MNMFSILLNQMLMMAALIFFGFILVRAKIIDSSGAKQISTILAMFVMPASMIASFHAEFNIERLKLFGWAVVAALITIISRIFINYFVFKKENRTEKYAATFANSGFFGIPIVIALFGVEGVFFMTPYIMCNNILQWTYGRALISGDKKAMTPQKAFTNPGMIGALIGLTLYITQFPLPKFAWNAVDSLASLNTSLAMIIIGSYLANSNLTAIFKNKASYLTVFMRLVFTPIIAILIIYLLPINNFEVEIVLTIASVAPSAVNTAILGRLFGGDYEYGARIVVLSSIFSIFTIPFMMQFAEFIYTL